MNKPDDPTALQVAGHTVTHRVVSNIQKASSDSGISFSYLMAQAGKESAFQPNAGSRASSAAGLFQFTRSTWLSLVKRHGAAHGLEPFAAAIKKTAKGDYVVENASVRQQILDLRRDPELSSQMAAEYAKDNKATLEKALHRPVDSTDLYLAHFLGPAGATRILKAKQADPGAPAAAILPQAATKNPSVFYDTSHTPRSVTQVYERIHHAIDKPMKQYARLETPAAAVPSHKGGKSSATAQPDLPWPFETGRTAVAPPVLLAQADEVMSGAAIPPAAAPGWQSADRVSRPMPPSPSETPTPDDSGIGKLLHSVKRNLFG